MLKSIKTAFGFTTKKTETGKHERQFFRKIYVDLTKAPSIEGATSGESVAMIAKPATGRLRATARRSGA